MMYELFVRVIDMSITASVVMIAVFIARGAMGKLPKRYSYLLWAIVAVRLLCPMGISSSFSVFNLFGERNVLPAELQRDSARGWGGEWRNDGSSSLMEDYASQGRAEEANGFREPAESETRIKPVGASRADMESQSQKIVSDVEEGDFQKGRGRMEAFVKYGVIVWICVGATLLIWNFFLMFLMKRRVSKAIRLRENIYECDDIPTPFVMGFLRPRIYIPFRMGEEEQDYIIRHERYHIARKDNLAKLMAFLLTCIYWFHPLVWLSYFMMMRDMEMSCDEYVLQKSVRDIREQYSRSLLGLATNERNIGVGLIAFGESNARRRVKHIMKYKKCGKWIGMIAIGAVLVVGVACLTDARRGEADDDNKAETASTQKPGTWDLSEESQYPAVASVSIDGNQLEVQCATDEKKPKSGNYEGDSLVIQTSRDEKVIDRREVSFGKGKKVYFPAKGIELSLADYDGDGRKNDFALGQGQGADPVLGNYMNYRFFGLDADGTILEYGTSSEDGVSIRTVPGKYSPLYSPLFKRKNGELIYEGLGEEGVEDMSATIVRHISVSDEKARQEPMKSILKGIENNMPSEVVEELQKKGVWHVMRGEGSEVQYNLANGENGEDVTLRLDFTYIDGGLISYVSKDYGFTEEMKKSGGDGYPSRNLLGFADDFCGGKAKFVEGTTLEEVSRLKKKGVIEEDGNTNTIAPLELPKIWNDGNHNGYEYYGDIRGATYLLDSRIDMVVKFETVQ